jgi:hypothetical protein
MTHKQEERRKPSVALVITAVVGLLLVLGLLYFLVSGGAFPQFGGSPTAKARTLVSVNLREGPGINYPTVGGAPAGIELKVVGRNQDGSWLMVETKSGKAWVTGGSEYVEIDEKALARVPVVEAPPLAYNVNNVQVNQVLNQIPLVVHHPDRVTCASHAGLNNLMPSVADGNVIGPHAGDFVLVGKENVLLEYSKGTFQLIRDNPIARFDNGEKYLPLTTAMQMFEKGEIVWTGSFGAWPARGVPGCDESAKPD